MLDDNIFKKLTLALKTAVSLGVALVVAYSINQGYFPRDINIGDGIVFIVVALFFGFSFIFFSYSLYYFGLFILNCIRNAVMFTHSRINKLTPCKKIKIYKSYKIHTSNIPYVIVGALIFLFMLFDTSSILNTMVSILVFTISSETVVSDFNAYMKIRQKNETTRQEKTFFENYTTKIKVVAVTVFLSLFIIGNIGEILTAGTMRLSKLRFDEVDLYVKEPYASILTENKIPSQEISKISSDYRLFTNANILLTGIGSESVIEFAHENSQARTVRLKIPNDYFIQSDLSKN